MRNHDCFSKKWMPRIVAAVCVFLLLIDKSVVVADTNQDKWCHEIFGCFEKPDDLPSVDGVLELNKTELKLGEILHGTFRITNNTDSEISRDAYEPFIEVIIFDSMDDYIYHWPTHRKAEQVYRTATIPPHSSWEIDILWDQRSMSTWEYVPPGEYLIYGYSPFRMDGEVSRFVTITPEPSTGVFVLLIFCGLFGRKI